MAASRKSNPRATKRTRYRFKSTSGSDKGKTYDWSWGQLEDTIFENEHWDKTAVRSKVKALQPGQQYRGRGGVIERLSNPSKKKTAKRPAKRSRKTTVTTVMTTKTTKTTRKSNPGGTVVKEDDVIRIDGRKATVRSIWDLADGHYYVTVYFKRDSPLRESDYSDDVRNGKFNIILGDDRRTWSAWNEDDPGDRHRYVITDLDGDDVKGFESERRSNPVEPTVKGFITILVANLTQYDMVASAREAKGRGSVNIYRLGHLLEASQKMEDRLKPILGSSSPDDLRTLKKEILGKAFLPDFPPAKKTAKAIDKYLADGKAPKYPVTKIARRNPMVEKRTQINRGTKAWYRRNLILPLEVDHPQAEPGETVVGTLHAWHGGQNSAVYSLASTGDHDYVSASMVERAVNELERDLRKASTKQDVSDLVRTLGELNIMLGHPEDYTTGEDEDSGYDDYGLRIDEIEANPRKSNPAAPTSRAHLLAARLISGG